jgi:hypothetical protein
MFMYFQHCGDDDERASCRGRGEQAAGGLKETSTKQTKQTTYLAADVRPRAAGAHAVVIGKIDIKNQLPLLGVEHI